MKFNSGIANLIIFLFFIISVSVNATALNSDTVESRANTFYDSGNCEKAIKAYNILLKVTASTNSQKDVAQYRIAYCHYTLGNTDEAVEGFKKIVQKYPNQDEARLRYAESLAAQAHYDESVNEASKIKDPTLINDARLLMAKNLLEVKQEEGAIQKLDELPAQNEAWEPVIEYWRGTAYNQLFDYNASENAFTKSLKSSSDKLWTKEASETWLKSIRESKRWVHVLITGTWGNDTNLGSVTYKSTKGEVSDPVYYVKDHFKGANLELNTKALHLGKTILTPSFGFYSQFYSVTNYGYNSQSFSLALGVSRPLSYIWNLRASFTYLDSRYNWSYSQDYFNTSLYAEYALSKRTTISLGLHPNLQVVTNSAFSVGPSLGFNSDLAWFYWYGLAQMTFASGQKASFVTSYSTTTVSKGVLLSNYTSNTYKLGIGRELPLGLDLGGNVTLAKTNYAKEANPSGSSFDTDPRKDTSVTYQGSLSKTLIQRKLTVTGSYSYTRQTSSGFQGLLYSTGSGPDYNISKKLAQISLTYGL